MSATDTQAVIEHYFDLMGRGEDFKVCYADDVRWTTYDGGTSVVGPAEVQRYVTELHQNMPDGDGPPIAYTAEAAYLEGDFPDPRSSSGDRVAWCLVYDVADGLITSARLYGGLGFLAPVR